MAREGGRLGGSKAPGREGDPRDKRIEQQDREISRLRGELARATRDRDRWKRRSERLKSNSTRRGGPAADRQPPLPRTGRKVAAGIPDGGAGARYGRQGCRPRPRQVDEAFAAPVPTACPDCGGAVDVTRVASQYQEELPEVRPLGAAFRYRGRALLAVPAAGAGPTRLADLRRAGAAGVQLGPGVVGLVVEMHTEMGVPLAKVANLLRNTFSTSTSPRAVSPRLLHRAARDATPAYQELCEQVRNAPVVTPDETGLARRRRASLAVGVRHGGHDGLCDLSRPRVRRCRHRAGDRLRRRARARRVAGVPVLQGLVAPKLHQSPAPPRQGTAGRTTPTVPGARRSRRSSRPAWTCGTAARTAN